MSVGRLLDELDAYARGEYAPASPEGLAQAAANEIRRAHRYMRRLANKHRAEKDQLRAQLRLAAAPRIKQ